MNDDFVSLCVDTERNNNTSELHDGVELVARFYLISVTGSKTLESACSVVVVAVVVVSRLATVVDCGSPPCWNGLTSATPSAPMRMQSKCRTCGRYEATY